MPLTSGYITIVVDGVDIQVDAAAVERARRQYPEMAPYLDDPEVLAALVDLTEGNIDEIEFVSRLRQTNAWRTSVPTEADWQWTLTSDPGRAAALMQQASNNIVRIASSLGMTVPSRDLSHLADQSLRFGWDDQTIRNTILQYVNTNPDATISPLGELATSMDNIRRLAGDYFLQVTENQVRDLGRQVAEGTLTLDGVRMWAQRSAGARWTHLQPLIDQGITMRDYFEPVRQSVSRTLGLNPEDIDLTSDRWSELTDFVDDKGNRRSMTQSEASRWARGQREYRQTDTYRESSFGVVKALAQSLGVMG